MLKVDQEKTIEQGKCSESKGIARKKKSRTFVCENCGTIKPIRYNEYPDRFCSQDCMKQQSVNRWLACSLCLNKCGLGSSQASRQIGINKSSILRQWAKLGIRSKRSDTLKLKALHKTRETRFKELWAAYERAWMDEIRKSLKLPDWGALWSKQKNLETVRNKSRMAYHALSDDEKKQRNRKVIERRRLMFERFPEKKLQHEEKIKKWRKENPEKHRESIRRSLKKRKQTDHGFRVLCNMRNRLREIMRSSKNGGTDRISSLIGCSTRELSKHLESKFKKGMSWDNYGEWHVDHIIPCAAFDHEDPKQIKTCWHFTNLQPLWAHENLKKSSKIESSQMALLL